MLRIGLTAYLILATIISPALCCCTPARFVTTAPQAETDNEPAAPKPHCCCCPETRTSDESAPPQPKRPDHDPNSCPCKQHPTDSLPTSAGTIQIAEDLRTTQIDAFEALLSFTLPVAALQKATADSVETPPFFLTARARLCALQVFRC
jgi:hypothetical protein